MSNQEVCPECGSEQVVASAAMVPLLLCSCCHVYFEAEDTLYAPVRRTKPHKYHEDDLYD